MSEIPTKSYNVSQFTEGEEDEKQGAQRRVAPRLRRTKAKYFLESKAFACYGDHRWRLVIYYLFILIYLFVNKSGLGHLIAREGGSTTPWQGRVPTGGGVWGKTNGSLDEEMLKCYGFEFFCFKNFFCSILCNPILFLPYSVLYTLTVHCPP